MGAPEFLRIIAWTDTGTAVIREPEGDRETERGTVRGVGPVSAAAKTRAALVLVREARKLLREAGARRAYEKVAFAVASVEGAARHADLIEGRTRRRVTVQ